MNDENNIFEYKSNESAENETTYPETSSSEYQKPKKWKRTIKKIIIVVVSILAVGILLFVFRDQIADYAGGLMAYKPVIYLYPERETDVTVTLDLNGRLKCTFPKYDNGWTVTAQPDGTLVDAEGNEYSYLFWDGTTDTEWDFSEGFCVKGEDTAEFLREALSEQGLTPREYNEFIVYWLPLMQDNKYNVISFQGENYELSATLNITPQPDVIKRVFMAYYPSDSEVEIPPQTLSSFDRSGFTVVEWGGTEVNPG